MIPYIDNGIGVPTFRAPFTNPIVDMANFFVKADYQKLHAVCDRYLNAPLKGSYRYVPFMPYVIMTYAYIQGYATTDSMEIMGQLPENDLVIWIPTICLKQLGPIPIPTHFAMFPYRLYVDSAYGLASGREGYGFNKTFGKFQLPATISRPDLSLDVIGFRTFTPEQIGTWQSLISIRQVATGAPGTTWNGAQEARDAVKKMIIDQSTLPIAEGLVDIVDFCVEHFQPEVRQVSLKQFRDATNPLAACYQAIVEAPTIVTQFNGGGFVEGRYQLQVQSLASEPIATELGLELINGNQDLHLGFWAKTAFNMDTGTVIG